MNFKNGVVCSIVLCLVVAALNLVHPQSVFAAAVLKTKTIIFSQGTDKTRLKKIVIPNLEKIDSIDINNGDVNYSIKSDGIEIKVSNGDGEKVRTGGSYTPARKKYVTNQRSKDYNKDGFSGTLTKYVASGSYTPGDTKYVTNQRSKDYNQNGYKGSLSRYVASGSYTPAKSKKVTQSRSMSDTGNPNNFASSIYYNSGGYKGTLRKSGGLHFKRTGTDNNYRTSYVRNTFSSSDKPNSKPSYSGYWRLGNRYEMEWIHVYSPKLGRYSSGIYYNKHTSVKTWESVGGFVSPKGNYTWDDYFNNHGGKYNFKMTSGFQRKPIYILKWHWVRYIGRISQNFSGTVTKPAIDTRVYRYQGNVTKPAVDTRVFRYKGEVTKPAVDTRTYETDYAYKVTIKYTQNEQELDHVPSSVTFDDATLNGNNQTMEKTIKGPLLITDTGDSPWHVTVKATQVMDSDGHALPKGSLKLITANQKRVLDLNGEIQDHKSLIPRTISVDDANRTIISEGQAAGARQYEFTGYKLQLSLNPDSTYVNQDQGKSDYTTVLTWTVVSGP